MKVRSPIVERNVEILDFKLPIGQKSQFLATLHTKEPKIQTNKVVTYNVVQLPVPPPP